MKIAGEYDYDHPRETVWDAILDPDVLSGTLPGCEDLKRTGDNEYAGKLKMKVGPVQGVFAGEVEITDLDPPNSYKLNLKGKGAPGFVNGNGSIRLEENDNGGTRLFYDIDAQIGGRIAAVGQRLVDSSAKVITRQGLEGLGRQLDLRSPGTKTTETTEAAEGTADAAQAGTGKGATSSEQYQAPSQAELAREVAREVANDLIPPALRWPLIVLALLAVAAIVALVVRSLG
jgi:carbon monoxide dehydrogenase subunit G